MFLGPAPLLAPNVTGSYMTSSIVVTREVDDLLKPSLYTKVLRAVSQYILPNFLCVNSEPKKIYVALPLSLMTMTAITW